MSTESKSVSNEDIMEYLKLMEKKFMASIDAIGLRIETTSLTSDPSIKKKVVTKKVADDKPPVNKLPANTMYWWRQMYATKDPSIEKFFTDKDIENAKVSCTKIKDKDPQYKKDCAIGQCIYSTFDAAKKSQLKGMYETFKKEHAMKAVKLMDVEQSSNKKEEKEEKEEKSSDKKEEKDSDN